MKLVNTTKYRSSDIEAVYNAALAHAENPHPVDFLVATTGYTSGKIDGRRHTHAGGITEISLHFGSCGRKEPGVLNGIEVLATGRTLDDGTFGQLTKYVAILLANHEVEVPERPSRTVPRWARDLSFVEREAASEKETRFVKRVMRNTAPIHSSYFSCFTGYVTREDLPNLLDYALVTEQNELARVHGRKNRAIQSARSAWMDEMEESRKNLKRLAQRVALLERLRDEGERR